MLADLFNVPSDFQSTSWFSFANRDAHVLANRAALAASGITLPEYPLDPIPPVELDGWLYNHQAMHNAVNAFLGLQGNDLTDVDPKDKAQLATWVQLHANEHVTWGLILGYG